MLQRTTRVEPISNYLKLSFTSRLLAAIWNATVDYLMRPFMDDTLTHIFTI